jgi:hypothetical protein
MKRVLYAIPVVALFATVAYSQAPGGQMQGQKIGLATSLQRGYNGFKTNFTAAAEKMPEADYSFKPGSTPEARTYAQVIAHIAQAQFGQCSGLKGVPNPMAGKQLEQELKTKAEVTKALADSLEVKVKSQNRKVRVKKVEAGEQAGCSSSDPPFFLTFTLTLHFALCTLLLTFHF